jgi:hypothetical protein
MIKVIVRHKVQDIIANFLDQSIQAIRRGTKNVWAS